MTRSPLFKGIAPVYPGAILRADVIPALGRSKVEIASLLGISRQHLYDILDGKKPITVATALRIGKLCGNGPEIWLQMQAAFDLAAAEKEMAADIAKVPTLTRGITMNRDFETLQDALDAAHLSRAMADVASGATEVLSADEVLAFLDAASPLAFWRGKRGLTQAALAEAAEISQSYLAGLEAKSRKGTPALFLRLARALAVRMEDIVPDDSAGEE